MKTLTDSIQKTINKFKKTNPQAITKVIQEYQKSLLETLVESGHVYVTPELRIDIVPITPRRYVLRGQEYRSVRLYKLKSTISDDSLYDKIAEEYNLFREDLE